MCIVYHYVYEINKINKINSIGVHVVDRARICVMIYL